MINLNLTRGWWWTIVEKDRDEIVRRFFLMGRLNLEGYLAS
jgi:hypothetical protein